MAFKQGRFFKDMYELPELLLCQLVVSNTEPLTIGNKRLIKRRLFDQYIEQEYSI